MSLLRTNRADAKCIVHFSSVLFVALVIACGQLTIEAQAQDSVEMSAVYGRGVHAYFANDIASAEQLFSQVVQVGSTDPRVYYFRAMTRLRTGRQSEAEEDMKIGAAYEARDPGSRHSIGIALQRVQGQGRRTLERFRREGRLNRVQQRRQQSRLRYEQLEQRGPQVLRSETPGQQNQLPGPSMQLTVPENSPSLALPEPAKAVDVPADSIPQPKVEDSNEDLFGNPAPEEPATPKPAEANDDPFAEAAEVETEPPMAEEEVAEPAPADDLFGNPEAESEATEEESPEAAPAEEESGEELDDLFGDSNATEEESPLGEADETEADMEEEAPNDEADIFGGEEESSDTAEDDDPFSSSKPKNLSEAPSLSENDKVESSKLFGILGRVVGSTIPWKDIQLPTVGLPMNAQDAADADSPAGIALGPLPAEPGSVTPATAETPVDPLAEEDIAEEDLFGDASSDTPASEDSFEDPFEIAEEDMESEEVEVAEEETVQPEEEDDPFGDF